jgi:ethanolamine ammonia-lyase small subunit
MKPALTNPQPLTTARLSLGNSSAAIPTHEQLRFQLDHALARDAVHAALDVPLLERGLHARGLTPLTLRSAARNRAEYLRRPDLGRTLSPASIGALQKSVILSGARSAKSKDPETASSAHAVQALSTEDSPRIIFILADGLSALALERHALPLLDATLRLLDPKPYTLTPVVQNARVALADHIGHLLSAQLTVLFIGERPGLSSPDSLGVYLTWQPRPGRTDAERNCISNIRAEGLSYAEAAHRIAHYIAEARRLHTTGIALKDPVMQAVIE